MIEYQIKITGSAELGQQLDTTKSLRVGMDVDIYSVEKFDNQDGTCTVRYKSKITSAIDVMQGDKVIKGRDKGSESKKTRGAIWALQDEVEKLDVDQEVFYKQVQGIIRRNLKEIYERYKQEINF